MHIVGAGLSGLLAAHAWPQARVFEAAPTPLAAHHALLRFRSNAVALATGIDFREVTVHKGIWFDNTFLPPSIMLANLYSNKVLGSISGDRSIWNLESAQRFIAPENFYELLIETIGSRITWDFKYEFDDIEPPIINTAPLPIVLKQLKMFFADVPFDFKRSPILVERYRVHNADAFQTIYFPDPALDVYRASMTGSLLIIERMIRPFNDSASSFKQVIKAFGINAAEPLDSVEQKFGKIVTMPSGMRQALLLKLTNEHGIFSLGRFATWRNILLDDVIQDISVIRKLMKASGYERALFAGGKS